MPADTTISLTMPRRCATTATTNMAGTKSLGNVPTINYTQQACAKTVTLTTTTGSGGSAKRGNSWGVKMLRWRRALNFCAKAKRYYDFCYIQHQNHHQMRAFMAKQNFMGNSQLYTTDLPTIDLSKCTYQSTNYHHTKITSGKYKVLTHHPHQEALQEFSFKFSTSQQLQLYRESFRWRYGQPFIVNCKYFQDESMSTFCSESFCSKVYIEHIPFRLSDIGNMGIGESLRMQLSAFAGFKQLLSCIGYFKVNEEMVGINSRGQVKVWLNSDLSKNYLYNPFYQQSLANNPLTVNTEHLMISQIIGMIESRTDYEQNTPITVRAQFELESICSFGDASKFILGYAQQYGIQISNEIEPFDHQLELPFDFSHQEESSPSITSQITSQLQQASSPTHIPLSSPLLSHANQLTKLEHQYHRPFQINNINPIDNHNQSNQQQQHQNHYKLHQQPNYYQLHSTNSPKIIFNYQSQQQPIQNIRVNSSCQWGERRRQSVVKVTFSDISERYTLDQQLIQDMLRYSSRR